MYLALWGQKYTVTIPAGETRHTHSIIATV